MIPPPRVLDYLAFGFSGLTILPMREIIILPPVDDCLDEHFAPDDHYRGICYRERVDKDAEEVQDCIVLDQLNAQPD